MFLLPYEQKIANKRVVLLIEIENKSLCNSLTVSKSVTKEYQENTDSKFVRKTMIHDILIKKIKNNIIIVVQYTIVHYVHFLFINGKQNKIYQ